MLADRVAIGRRRLNRTLAVQRELLRDGILPRLLSDELLVSDAERAVEEMA
jgi:hypothetical protein